MIRMLTRSCNHWDRSAGISWGSVVPDWFIVKSGATGDIGYSEERQHGVMGLTVTVQRAHSDSDSCADITLRELGGGTEWELGRLTAAPVYHAGFVLLQSERWLPLCLGILLLGTAHTIVSVKGSHLASHSSLSQSRSWNKLWAVLFIEVRQAV
ncbi:uncharacterized protein fads6 [Chiloscyllium plagiosum]|uniref:uncharacterized protein fads6 n=1 Tax=Chiloscyllium plagiosum TaxID=36176 RepID=UPI001CB7F301|nr:uncharacterized protein fads6 [Chiloscyllium plagiosum]